MISMCKCSLRTMTVDTILIFYIFSLPDTNLKILLVIKNGDRVRKNTNETTSAVSVIELYFFTREPLLKEIILWPWVPDDLYSGTS